VARFLYEQPLTRQEAMAKLGGLRTEITGPGQWINVAVEVVGNPVGGTGTSGGPTTGTVVGDVGLCWTSEAHRQAEIGYAFLPDHHGRGYATEAAAAMVELAFSGLGVHRVSGRIDARNQASGAVLRRLGMRLEAQLVENELVKGEWTGEAVYAVLDREWRYPPAR
jgi:RimJ/RimL family protein N-acetyltransferase